jgi:hypothetical protein
MTLSLRIGYTGVIGFDPSIVNTNINEELST